MTATLIVRHPVQSYATWRSVYDGPEVAALHQKYGVANARVAGATPMWEWLGDEGTVFSY